MVLLRVDTYPNLLDSVELRIAVSPYTVVDTFFGGEITEPSDGVYEIDVGTIEGNWLLTLFDVNDDVLGIKYASNLFTQATDYPPWLVPGASELTTVLAAINSLIALFNNSSVRLPAGQLFYYNNEIAPIKRIATPDYTARSVKVCIETKNKIDVATIPNASLTKTTTSISFTLPPAVLSSLRAYNYSVRDTTTDEVLGEGTITGLYAPYAASV